jgi:hypothetical protein
MPTSTKTISPESQTNEAEIVMDLWNLSSETKEGF